MSHPDIVQPGEGCKHREHKSEAVCNKLCNPGKTLCPHHQLIEEVRADEKLRREKREANVRKRIAR